MKKQFQILAATLITVAFISCSKGDIDIPEKQQIPAEEQTAPNKPGGPFTIDPLSVGLKGWFKFNNNLKDAAGKLQDGVQWPLKRTGVIYATDRKGSPNAAVKLDGNYAIIFPAVPQQDNTSMSIWIKRGGVYPDATIISPNGYGPRIDQNGDIFKGLVQNGWILPEVYSNNFYGGGWYHIVITFDGEEMKMYINGVLQGTYNDYPHSIGSGNYDYYLAATLQGFWSGYADDLRFYSRTLSSTDVQKLFNQ